MVSEVRALHCFAIPIVRMKCPQTASDAEAANEGLEKPVKTKTMLAVIGRKCLDFANHQHLAVVDGSDWIPALRRRSRHAISLKRRLSRRI